MTLHPIRAFGFVPEARFCARDVKPPVMPKGIKHFRAVMSKVAIPMAKKKQGIIPQHELEILAENAKEYPESPEGKAAFEK